MECSVGSVGAAHRGPVQWGRERSPRRPACCCFLSSMVALGVPGAGRQRLEAGTHSIDCLLPCRRPSLLTGRRLSVSSNLLSFWCTPPPSVSPWSYSVKDHLLNPPTRSKVIFNPHQPP